jgi:hypothetical protein
MRAAGPGRAPRSWRQKALFGSVSFTGATVNGRSMETLSPVQITMPDTSVADMTSDGSFSVNYTGTGFAQWPGF